MSDLILTLLDSDGTTDLDGIASNFQFKLENLQPTSSSPWGIPLSLHVLIDGGGSYDSVSSVRHFFSLPIGQGSHTLQYRFVFDSYPTYIIHQQSPVITFFNDTVAPAKPTLALVNAPYPKSLSVSGIEAGGTVRFFNGNTEVSDRFTGANGVHTAKPGAFNGADTLQLTAKVMDVARNLSVASNLVSVRIDSTAPSAPILVQGSGVNAKVLTLNGAEAGSTVQLLNGATDVTAMFALGVGGNYTALPGAFSGHESLSLTATLTDPEGNVSAASNAVSGAIDSTAPVLNITSAAGLTATTEHTVAGTLNLDDKDLIVSLYAGYSLLGTVQADANGQWSREITLPSGDGLQFVTAVATDAADNVGTSPPATFVLDTTAPALAITIPGGLTRERSQKLSGTIGAGDQGRSVALYDGQTLLGTATTDGNGRWSRTIELPATDGEHAITALATDAAGNTGTSAATVFTLDTTAPPIPTLAQGVGPEARVLTVSGVEAGATVGLFNGPVDVTSLFAVGSDGRFTALAGAFSGSEALVLHATATDAAGNPSGPSNSVSGAIDSTAPVLQILVAAGLTSVRAQTISGSLSTGDHALPISVYAGTTWLGTAQADGTGAWSLAVALPASQGEQAITAKATDAAGNTGTSAALRFTLDTVAPAAPTLTQGSGVQSHVLTVGDVEAGASVRLLNGGTDVTALFVSGSGGTYTARTGAFTGTEAIALTAVVVDAAGNASPASPIVTGRVDTTAPALAISSLGGFVNSFNQSLSGTIGAGDRSLPISLYAGNTLLGTAEAGSTGAWSLAVTLPATQGQQAVTAVATDAGGNQTTSAAVTYTVDLLAPTLTSAIPANGATGVARSVEIVLNFNEPVQAGSGRIYLRAGSSTGPVIEQFDVASSTRLTLQGSTLSIKPTERLPGDGSRYFITQDESALRDAAGNPFSPTSQYAFSTVDQTRPTVTAFNQAQSTRSFLTFNLSESSKGIFGNVNIYTDTGVLVPAILKNVQGNQLVIALGSFTDSVIDTARRYNLKVGSDAILDASGNGMLATTFAFRWDNTEPTVVAFEPAEGSIGARLGTNITLRFSEEITPGRGTISLLRQSVAGTMVENFAVDTSSRLTFWGNELIIDPSAELESGTDYWVVLDSGLIKDTAGNSYAGTASYKFTTEAAPDTTAPTVVTFSPVDGATGLAIDANISLNFSEPVLAVMGGTIDLMTDYGYGHQMIERISVLDVDRVKVSGNVVTVDPSANLLPNTGYHLGFNQPFGDLAGNMFTFSHGTYNFTTAAPQSGGGQTNVTAKFWKDASKAPSESNKVGAVNLTDAISILKMIVGLSVNSNNVPLSPYQAVAADFDQSGSVDLGDAIGVLKMVVGLAAPTPAWKYFVDAKLASFYNATQSLNHKAWSAGAAMDVSSTADSMVKLVGVLTGDVDGSWAG